MGRTGRFNRFDPPTRDEPRPEPLDQITVADATRSAGVGMATLIRIISMGQLPDVTELPGTRCLGWQGDDCAKVRKWLSAIVSARRPRR